MTPRPGLHAGLADEINRATPRTQGALPEAMTEGADDGPGRDQGPARPVLRCSDPEPAPVPWNLSPTRGPARPLHGRDDDGLPGVAVGAPRSTSTELPSTPASR